MRKSLQDIAHMVQDRPYPGKLPEELKPYHCYLSDSGHNVLCVLEMHLVDAEGKMDDYEVPVPVKYVLEKGYGLVDGYVIVAAEYSQDIGLLVDDEYDEY